MKKLFSVLLIFAFLVFPFLSQAATASAFTVVNVPEDNFYLTDTNKLIMDIALPNAADDGAGIECDGSTTTAAGTCDAISTGAVLLAISSSTLTTGGLMCTDSITVPTKIFRHATSCTTDGTASGVTNYLGTAAISTAYISVSAASQKWAFRDTTVNSVYDAGEDIYIDSDLSLLYNADKLASVTVSNVGSAVDADLAAIRIYQESGTAGFDSSADTQIGSDTSSPFLAQVITTGSSTAYVNGASVTTSNRRIYIAVDISNSPTVNSTIQARIVAGATTIAMAQTASANNGPTDAALTNTSIQAIRKPPERIPPTSSITSPVSGATIEVGKNYIITGSSNDAGGSSVQMVEISFDNGATYASVTPKTALSAGFTWEYVWVNPAVGIYTIKVRANDWLSNREIPGAGVTVTVAVPVVVTPAVPAVPAEPAVPLPAEALAKEGATPAVPAVPAAPALKVSSFVSSLYRGITSSAVEQLQTVLKQDPEIYPEGLVTGFFGSLTRAAVGRFQIKHGILKTSSDYGYGYVGPRTRAKLNQLFSE